MLGLILMVVVVLGLVLSVPRIAAERHPEYFRGPVAVYGPTLALLIAGVVIAVLWVKGII